MKDVEAALAAMLSTRAEGVEPAAGHRAATLRGARRRRARTAIGAVVASFAIVAGGLGAVGALEDDSPPIRPAAPDEPAETSGTFGFTSAPGEYPFAATGQFRDAEWQLRVAAVTPGHDSRLRITLQMKGARLSLMSTSENIPRIDPLFVRYEDGSRFFDGDVALVFGAVVPEAATVDVWVNHISRPDRTFDAHLIEGYDAKAGVRADYFVAFVPAQVGTGLVIANDADGDEVGVAAIPR